MTIYLNAQSFQAILICIGTRLAIVVSNDYTTSIQTYFFEFTTQAKYILIVSDTQVATHLVLFNIERTDYHYNFGTIAKLHQHAQLAIRQETRQHTAGMIIVE